MEVKKIISVEIEQMIEGITSIPTMKESLRVAIRKSGLREKQIAWELEIAPPQFSRIMTGDGNFPEDKLVPFMEICKSHIPLQWLASQCGYELRVTPKTLEDQLEKERHEKEELKRDFDALIKILKTVGFEINNFPQFKHLNEK